MGYTQLLIIVQGLVALMVVGLGCQSAPVEADRTLTIFASTSLGPTLDTLSRSFKSKFPSVSIHTELSNSRQACMKVTEQGRQADVILAADAEVIDQLMTPIASRFVLSFASNGLVLAYAPDSPLAGLLRSGTPWQELLAGGKYRVGIGNPQTSPVGYRALLVLKLNDMTAPAHLRLGKSIARKLRAEHRRAGVSHLLGPLLGHELDAAFVYRSEALQQHLPFVALNRRVDFSDPALQDSYAQVSMTLPGCEQTMFGSAAMYGLTIPRSAQQSDLAYAFVRHLLSDAGRHAAQQHKLTIFPQGSLILRGKTQAPLFEAAASARSL